jgi:putative Mn2+ efflux pump MntP
VWGVDGDLVRYGGESMSLLTLLGIAVGLAMDAFAVSIGVGLNAQECGLRKTIRLAWHFGLFQALMPILGWVVGKSVSGGSAASITGWHSASLPVSAVT